MSSLSRFAFVACLAQAVTATTVVRLPGVATPSATDAKRPSLRVPALLAAHSNVTTSATTDSEIVVTQPPQVAATAALAATTAAATAAGMVAVQEGGRADSAPPSGEAMVTELEQELKEVKQHRTNIAQMQQALTADVALLRESSALQRVSATRHSRKAAQLQVRRSEQLVKDLSAMLRDSRADAVEDAKTMLNEATEVREAADVLATEASAQLASLAPKAGRHADQRRSTEATEAAGELRATAAPRVKKHHAHHHRAAFAKEQQDELVKPAALPVEVEATQLAESATSSARNASAEATVVANVTAGSGAEADADDDDDEVA